jgi:hypothetical protein
LNFKPLAAPAAGGSALVDLRGRRAVAQAPILSDFAEQKQNDQDDENGAADAHSAVAETVTVTAETAAEASQQENDENDDEYQSERHGASPQPGSVSAAAFGKTSASRRFGSG